MLNISFLDCTKVELWDLTVCFVINGKKFQIPAVTWTVVTQCSISNLSEIFLYTTMYLNFMFLDHLVFELLCKNTHTKTHIYRDKHKDSDKYSLVAFAKTQL